MGVKKAKSFKIFESSKLMFALKECNLDDDYVEAEFNIVSACKTFSDQIPRAMICYADIGCIGKEVSFNWACAVTPGWHFGVTGIKNGEWRIVWDWMVDNCSSFEELVEKAVSGDFHDPQSWRNYRKINGGSGYTFKQATLGVIDRTSDSLSMLIGEIEYENYTLGVYAYYCYGSFPSQTYTYYDEEANEYFEYSFWDLSGDETFYVKYGSKFYPIEILEPIMDGLISRGGLSYYDGIWQKGMTEILFNKQLAAKVVKKEFVGDQLFYRSGYSGRANSKGESLQHINISYNAESFTEYDTPQLLETCDPELAWQNFSGGISMLCENYSIYWQTVPVKCGAAFYSANLMIPAFFTLDDYLEVDFNNNVKLNFVCYKRKLASQRVFEVRNVKSLALDGQKEGKVEAVIGGSSNEYFVNVTFKNAGRIDFEIKHWNKRFIVSSSEISGYKATKKLKFDFIPYITDSNNRLYLRREDYFETAETPVYLNSQPHIYFSFDATYSPISPIGFEGEGNSSIEYNPDCNFEGEVTYSTGTGTANFEQLRTFDYVLCRLNKDSLEEVSSLTPGDNWEAERCFFDLNLSDMPAFVWFGNSGYKKEPSETDYHIKISKKLDAGDPDGTGASYSPLPSFKVASGVSWESENCSISTSGEYIKIYNFTDDSPEIHYNYPANKKILFPPYRFIFLEVKIKNGEHIPNLILEFKEENTITRNIKGFLYGDWQEIEIEGQEYKKGLIAFDITAPNPQPTNEQLLVGDNYLSLIELTKRKGFEQQGSGEPTENLFIPDRGSFPEGELGWSHGAFYLDYPGYSCRLKFVFEQISNEITEIIFGDFYCKILEGLKVVPISALERDANIKGHEINLSGITYTYYFNRGFLILVDNRLVCEALTREIYEDRTPGEGQENITLYESNYATANFDFFTEGSTTFPRDGLYPNYEDLKETDFFKTNILDDFSQTLDELIELINDNKCPYPIYLGEMESGGTRVDVIYDPENATTIITKAPIAQIMSCPVFPAWIVTDIDQTSDDLNYYIRLKVRLFADFAKIILPGSDIDPSSESSVSILKFFINGAFIGNVKILQRLKEESEPVNFILQYLLVDAGEQLFILQARNSCFESNRNDSKGFFKFRVYDEQNELHQLYYDFDEENSLPLPISTRFNSARIVNISIFNKCLQIVQELLRMRQGKARKPLPDGLNYEDFVNI